jgi:hypothetical protein
MSPARGFSMELGSVITIILATRLSKFPLEHPSMPNTDRFCRAPCVYHSVHYWCHRWCWSL